MVITQHLLAYASRAPFSWYIIKCLIDLGDDVNLVCGDGRKPLEFAAQTICANAETAWTKIAVLLQAGLEFGPALYCTFD